MIHKYNGSYFRGSNIGTKRYKQRIDKIIKNTHSWTGYIIGFISIMMLISFLYFNKKEDRLYKRNNVEDTVELIQKVAKYNLESDLAKNQTVQTARNNSINYRNPANVNEIEQQKQKALIAERHRQSQYMTQHYALDDGIAYETPNKNNEMHNTHQEYTPQQNSKPQYINNIPLDDNKQKQIDMMYNVQFENQKPHQTINSPFIHPQETTRPLAPQPSAFNNTLDTGNNMNAFLQNVPSNIFKQDFFKATDNYESPYLSSIDNIPKYENSCTTKSNINKNIDPKIRAFNQSDFYYL